MSPQLSRGSCEYCGRSLTRGGMTRHLRSCARRRDVIEAADAGMERTTSLLHLQVQDWMSGAYWLQLEVDGSARLRELDRYLRAIWLECCGHLSAFSTGGPVADDLPMTRKLASVFHAGAEVTHIYDFGTETALQLKLVDERQGTRTTARPIALMARNAPPSFVCEQCDAPASRVCLECASNGEPGLLCDRHARGHPHTDYGMAPLVNSPRTGICGYDGPAVPPY